MRSITDSEAFRKDIVTKLNSLIDDNEISEKLEQNILDYASKEANQLKIIIRWDNTSFAQLYIDRMRSIYLNLKNPKLLDSLKSSEINTETLAYMTHQEMNPDHWKGLIDKKMRRDANKYNNNTQASTDMFTCGKCKSKRCTYYELQTRSADEPATIFVTCLECGKNWKS